MMILQTSSKIAINKLRHTVLPEGVDKFKYLGSICIANDQDPENEGKGLEVDDALKFTLRLRDVVRASR